MVQIALVGKIGGLDHEKVDTDELQESGHFSFNHATSEMPSTSSILAPQSPPDHPTVAPAVPAPQNDLPVFNEQKCR
jgi:hypothetical protein